MKYFFFLLEIEFHIQLKAQQQQQLIQVDQKNQIQSKIFGHRIKRSKEKCKKKQQSN
jgi:hypothetical protein